MPSGSRRSERRTVKTVPIGRMPTTTASPPSSITTWHRHSITFAWAAQSSVRAQASAPAEPNFRRARPRLRLLRQSIIRLKRLGDTVACAQRTPRVLNKRDIRGPLPPNARYCGRPSPLGNPFVIGRDGTRDEVCDKYEAWPPTQPKLMAMIATLRRLRSRLLLRAIPLPLRLPAAISQPNVLVL